MFDIVIAGGGLVGASLARALSGTGLSMAVVEPVVPGEGTQSSYDARVIALSHGSRRILEGIGAWPLVSESATPIRHIHVSDRGHVGMARLDARSEGVESLGYVVEAAVLGRAVAASLGDASNVSLLRPGRLVSVSPAADEYLSAEVLAGDSRQTLKARLLVVADGGRSLAREQSGITAHVRDYGQTAIIANLTPERDHRGVAYERFTDTGPIALLPMGEGRCSLVWTVRSTEAGEILGLEDALFLDRFQRRFGHRLGRFLRVGRRSAYPLGATRVSRQTGHRTVVIGNAAHTVHPVAGQGFNLGLRDVAALAEVLVDANRGGQDLGDRALLERYVNWRGPDHRAVMSFTELLVQIFSNGFAPLAAARNLGLLALDLLPPAKHVLARRAMGLTGRQPRLARGLPL